MAFYEKNFRIDYDKVNKNNKMTNKAFLNIFQEIGAMHSDSVGYGLNDASKTNLAWIILNWKLKIFSRPKWNTNIKVKTWSSGIEKSHVYRDYEMYDDNGTLLAIATSKWVVCDITTGRISRITEEMANAYESEFIRVFDEFDEKLKESEDYDFSKNFIVSRRDIDTNNHMNNLCYLDYAIEVLPEDIFENVDFTNIEIMYKKATLLNEPFCVLYKKISDSESNIVIKTDDLTGIHCIIKLKTD